MDEKLYESLKNEIEHIYVQMPWTTETTVKEMQGWMNGYAECHSAVLRILEQYNPNAKMPWDV